MGELAAGSVVLIPFPFSDLSRSKLRPALVIAAAERGDWVLCQITSQPYGDPRALPLEDSAFRSGGLSRASHVRPGKLFTAHQNLVVRVMGQLDFQALSDIIEAVVCLLRGLPSPRDDVESGAQPG